jgi:hypothetical protein
MEEQLVHHYTTLLHYLPCALDVPLLQIFFHLHNIFTLKRNVIIPGIYFPLLPSKGMFDILLLLCLQQMDPHPIGKQRFLRRSVCPLYHKQQPIRRMAFLPSSIEVERAGPLDWHEPQHVLIKLYRLCQVHAVSRNMVERFQSQ